MKWILHRNCEDTEPLRIHIEYGKIKKAAREKSLTAVIGYNVVACGNIYHVNVSGVTPLKFAAGMMEPDFTSS